MALTQLLLAIIVVLITVIVVYMVNKRRKAAKAAAAAATVAATAVATSAADLASLVSNAQTAAKNFNAAFQSILTNYYSTNFNDKNYYNDVYRLNNYAITIDIMPPGTLVQTAMTNIESNWNIIDAYVQKYLTVPNCSVTTSTTSCGYIPMVAALTPTTSAAATINAVTTAAYAAIFNLSAVTAALSSTAAAITTYLSGFSSFVSATGVSPNFDVTNQITVLNADVAQINSYSSQLTALAVAVKTSSDALAKYSPPTSA